MSCSSCGAAFAGACGRGTACSYNYHFGEPPQRTSRSTYTPSPSSSNSPLDSLSDYFLSGQFERDMTPDGPVPFKSDEARRREAEDERRAAEFLRKLAVFIGKVATAPFWGTYKISKIHFDKSTPESKTNGIKSFATTAAIWGLPMVMAGLSVAGENDRNREFPSMAVYADNAGHMSAGLGTDYIAARDRASDRCRSLSCQQVFAYTSRAPTCGAIIPWTANGRVLYSKETEKPADIYKAAAEQCASINAMSGAHCSPASIQYICNAQPYRQTIGTLSVTTP